MKSSGSKSTCVVASRCIAVSAIALGAMVLAESRPPLRVAVLVVAFFAVFHGHAHGRELPDGATALLYSLGFVMATGFLHGFGVLLGAAYGWSAGRPIVRAAGAGVMPGGPFFLYRALA